MRYKARIYNIAYQLHRYETIIQACQTALQTKYCAKMTGRFGPSESNDGWFLRLRAKWRVVDFNKSGNNRRCSLKGFKRKLLLHNH